jgi:ERCC4-type nuclease
MRAERLAVRRAMVCQVPGINRVRAERIIAEYPTISALLRVSVTKLERLKIKEAPLGHELAVALKRVFE